MILLLGGTSDSVVLAKKIQTCFKNVILSTATHYGEKIASSEFSGEIMHGKMDLSALTTFCEEKKIRCIVDATHPFAKIVSENSIEVSRNLGIMYLRYERPECESLLGNDVRSERIRRFDSYEEVGNYLNQHQGNALVTTGSKDIEKLTCVINDLSRLYVRLLPVSEQLIKMETLGFLPKQLILMQGPFSVAMNTAMLEDVHADFLITKESGQAGKTDEKIESALACGVEVLLINRPKVEYPVVYTAIEEIIAHLNTIDTLG